MTSQSTLDRQSVTVADSPQKGQTAPVDGRVGHQ
jgi:hypothetical protein